MTFDFRPPTGALEWAAYHAIRRRVLFTLRGNDAAYDPDHPDEHRPNHHPFILWHGMVAVGVIRVDVAQGMAIIRRVAIRDDLQRKGYGRRLLASAERFAVERGCTRALSHVDPGAVGFYARCGFRVVESSRASATVAMTRELT